MQFRHHAHSLGLAALVLCAGSSAASLLAAQTPSPRVPDGVQLQPLVLPQQSAYEPRATTSVADPRSETLKVRLRNTLRTFHEARQAVTRDQQQALRQLRERVGNGLRVSFRPGVGTPMEVKGPQLTRAETVLPRSGESRAQATAREFLNQQAALMRLTAPEAELVLTSEAVDDLDRTHLRYQQIYMGLEVWPGELIVHLDPRGDVDRVAGNFSPTPENVVIVPRLAAPTATDVARLHLGGGIPVGDPTLVLFASELGTPRLTYRVEVSQSAWQRYEVLVDAATGDVMRSHNLIANENVSGSGTDLFMTTRALNVWNTGSNFLMADTSKSMFDPTSDPTDANTGRGVIYIFDAQNQNTNSFSYIVSNNQNSWPLPDSVSAAFNLSEVYDYYLERHGRVGLDGAGGNMYAIVKFDSNFDNAFWDGQAMYFGDAKPYAGALDVVAHELTHGVVTHSANLEYVNQSGALNESFADVLGESAEARTFGSLDWLLGSVFDTPFRNMEDPGALSTSLGPYPSKMSEFYNLDTDVDNGGVHINSSIQNHCFYLLAEGLPNSIGLNDTELIFYRALTTSLTKNSRFIDSRLACVSAAEDLFGVGSAKALATADAFNAVELGEAGGSEDPPDTTPVSGDDATLFLYFDMGSEEYLLGRRELDLGDNSELGSTLYIDSGMNPIPVRGSRPSVSGDGTLAIFVDDADDAVLIDTMSGESEALGLAGEISSVSMAPDGLHYGFVFLDGTQPSNSISVIDISTDPGSSETYTLQTPQSESNSLNTVLFADAMTFSADNRLLIYDALNALDLNAVSGLKGDDADLNVWSIYALDLLSGSTLNIVPPTPGLQIGYPALSQTSDNFIVFDSLDDDTNESTILAGNLATGALEAVGSSGQGFGVPSFSGDDAAVHFSEYNGTDTATNYSLKRQPVTGRTTPNGALEDWVTDADFGVVYRRGSYSTPNAAPQGEINTPVTAVTIDPGGSVSFTGTGSDANGHVPLTYAWDFNGGASNSTSEDPGAVTFNNSGTYTVSFTVTDSQGVSDPTPNTRNVTVTGSVGTGGGGGGGCVQNPSAPFDPTLLLLLLLGFGIRFCRRDLESPR